MEDPRNSARGDADTERGEPGSADAYARGAASDEQPPDDSYLTTDGSAVESSGATVESEAGGGRVEAAAQREKYLRLAAEFENYKRRTTRERQEAGARAQADLVKQLLDALDDLARFAHVDPASIDAAAVVQGAELVERKLMKSLGAAGLETVNPVDQFFDPALHEAVGTEPALSREDDHLVARVYQPGYLFNGQLLRPARVVVKQWNG